MLVKIIDTQSKYYGQELKGFCTYYDYKHTGSSPDLYSVETPEGTVMMESTKIDVNHYRQQELEKELKRLGAKIGDKVRIIKSGSGSYSHGFDRKGVHIITKVSTAGNVEFNNGEANIFRPVVELV
jgi:hypothetical protein